MKKTLLLSLPLLCLSNQIALGQATQANNVRPATTAYLGWDGTGANSGSLDIKNLFGSQPINFYNGTGPTLRCVITSGGDFNLSGASNAFQINGLSILHYNSITSNLLCGYQAGNNSGTGTNNSFFGTLADQSFSTGVDNTAIGWSALQKNTTGKQNVAVGSQALATSSVSSFNTAVGYQAAMKWDGGTKCISAFGVQAAANSVTSFQIAAFGELALTNNTGDENSAFGSAALIRNTTGTNNAAFGDDALFNSTGSFNTGLGSEAARYLTSGSYNTFTGWWAGNNMSSGFSNTGYGSSVMGFNSQTCTGSFNTAVGDSALYLNSTGNGNTTTGYQSLLNNTTGSNNSAFGNQALFTNSTGTPNDAFGYQAAYSNTTGINNVALGYNTLYNNSTGNYNVAVGTNALASAASTNISTNTAVGYNAATAVTGNDNTAVGVSALQTATTSTKNSALGAYCLQNASTGNGQHCGFGFAALYNTSTGTNNSGFGYYAGASNTTGNHITCIGSGADVGAVGLANATAIGSSAITTANQMMYMGSSTALLYCAAGLWTGSDSRFKTNVQENVKGLSFIKKLRPVTYNLDTKTMDDFLVQNMSDSIKAIHKAGMDFTSSSSVIHAGFIAQEVETAASAAGFNSSIVHAPDNSSTHYALNYSEIVVPLVKAVQELSRTSDSLTVVTHKQDSIIRKQDSINSSLQSQINRIVSSCCPISAGHQMQGNNSGNNNSPNNSTGVISTELSDVNSIVLNQNAPNPFAEQTLITYNVPVINGSAQILFYNSNGVMIKSVDIKNAGQGQLNVYANDLSNGTYSYTLIVDGKIIDTKKMIKQQ